MDNHQYDSVSRNGSSEAFAADKEYRARLKHLRLCLWDSQDSEQANVVLSSMDKLTSLDVSIQKFCPDSNCRLLELVLNFRSPSMNHGRPWITSLRLSGVNLACKSFPRLPGAQSLKHLQLIDCTNHGDFLRMLSTLSLNPATFTVTDRKTPFWNWVPNFNNDANKFIRSLHTLGAPESDTRLEILSTTYSVRLVYTPWSCISCTIPEIAVPPDLSTLSI